MLSALIMAGGKARRMGGLEKALLKVCEKKHVRKGCARGERLCARVLRCGHRQHAAHKRVLQKKRLECGSNKRKGLCRGRTGSARKARI
ncbi:hypothetical protein B9Q11_03645 [Candidatus Marsarchaeota G2 archaeon ECH_B_SAG-F08]|uniref:MobA-like NTP transferase domain-containing protein n=1 Tax=Candidatus Marsarchaeota G2 archaeon ECH_B_SAG-F08 TaxID=1978165 RepID=A0A2R6BGA9_9ARCH|nr:MAG: hypothetical protein B9Q11_03645 [Candidatus Marsarchaeota G2 archaeon ECH_B_SAG-F08]